MKKLQWTKEKDRTIKELREVSGFSWDLIADRLGLARSAVIERARVLGISDALPRKISTSSDGVNSDDNRMPLPPGDPISWGAITKDTSLEGIGFIPPESTY